MPTTRLTSHSVGTANPTPWSDRPGRWSGLPPTSSGELGGGSTGIPQPVQNHAPPGSGRPHRAQKLTTRHCPSTSPLATCFATAPNAGRSGHARPRRMSEQDHSDGPGARMIVLGGMPCNLGNTCRRKTSGTASPQGPACHVAPSQSRRALVSPDVCPSSPDALLCHHPLAQAHWARRAGKLHQ